MLLQLYCELNLKTFIAELHTIINIFRNNINKHRNIYS